MHTHAKDTPGRARPALSRSPSALVWGAAAMMVVTGAAACAPLSGGTATRPPSDARPTGVAPPLPTPVEVTEPRPTPADPGPGEDTFAALGDINRVAGLYGRLAAVDQERVQALLAARNGLLVTRDGNEQDLFWEDLGRLGWSRAVPLREGDPAAARIWALTEKGRAGLPQAIAKAGAR